MTSQWFPELPILALNFWKVEQAKDDRMDFPHFWESTDRLQTRDCLKAEVVNFTSYGPFSTTAEISFKGPRRLSCDYLFVWVAARNVNMFWRNCTSCVVTKGNSALLMICGYITGLKAGAEFKCSSNISFYLYPQTLAEINELRQVWGGPMLRTISSWHQENEYARDIQLFHCQWLTGPSRLRQQEAS